MLVLGHRDPTLRPIKKLEADEEKVVHLILRRKVADDILKSIKREMQVNEDPVTWASMLIHP